MPLAHPPPPPFPSSAELCPRDITSRSVIKLRNLPHAGVTKAGLRALFDGFDLAPQTVVGMSVGELLVSGVPLQLHPDGQTDLSHVTSAEQVPSTLGALGQGEQARLVDNVYLGLRADGMLSGECGRQGMGEEGYLACHSASSAIADQSSCGVAPGHHSLPSVHIPSPFITGLTSRR